MPERPGSPDGWIPVNDSETIEIPAGSKATFVFEPDASGMWVDMIAASKFPGLTYEVIVDGDTRYGQSGIPPTDIDDGVTTHNPRLEVERRLKVIVRNPTSQPRTTSAQIRGVEA